MRHLVHSMCLLLHLEPDVIKVLSFLNLPNHIQLFSFFVGDRHFRKALSLQIFTVDSFVKGVFRFKRDHSFLAGEVNLLSEGMQLLEVLGKLEFTLMKVILK